MTRTQAAYERRESSSYLAAFGTEYSSVILGESWWEDRTRLEEKIQRDLERFEILSMDFEIRRHWYAGEIGFAQLAYATRLRYKDSGKILRDERENIIVGRHEGDGRWRLINKIVLRVDSQLEDDGPEI